MRSIIREINRTVQTSGGAKKVDKLEEMAADSMEDALNHVRYGDVTPEACVPDLRELRKRLPSIFGRKDHWLGRYVTEPRQFFDMLRLGAPQLRDQMLRMMDSIQLPAAALRPELTQRRRRTRGDFGNEVDIHRVYQGRCDVAWTKIHTEKVMATGNRLVHLVIDVSGPLREHADDSLWLGAAVMRIYEALTRMGCSVAISMYGASVGLWHSDPVRHGMVSVLVKDYGQPLREEQLAVATHLGCFRALVCPLLSIGGTLRNIDGGMGLATSDYDLRVASAEEDEQRGGNVITVGKAFNFYQAERIVYDFVQTHVHGEIAEGKTSRQLYGLYDNDEVEEEEVRF